MHGKHKLWQSEVGEGIWGVAFLKKNPKSKSNFYWTFIDNLYWTYFKTDLQLNSKSFLVIRYVICCSCEKATKHIWSGYKPPKTLSIHMLRKDQVWQQILWRSHLCWAHFRDGPRKQEKAEGDTCQAQKIKGKEKAIICLQMILLWAFTITSQADRFIQWKALSLRASQPCQGRFVLLHQDRQSSGSVPFMDWQDWERQQDRMQNQRDQLSALVNKCWISILHAFVLSSQSHPSVSKCVTNH